MNPQEQAMLKANDDTGALFFYLSYANAQGAPDDSDPRVRPFFTDLSAAVTRAAGLPSNTPVGFFDQNLPLGSDWNAGRAAALGRAQVLVPLLSPTYFQRSLPERERLAFLHRLQQSGSSADVAAHVLPLLWVPLAPWDSHHADDAFRPDHQVADYEENGMRAMGLLPEYRQQYATLMQLVAQRIVEVVRRRALPPSTVADLGEPGESLVDPDFVVVVLTARPSRSGARQWRPFAGHPEVDVAAQAAGAAERLGSATQVLSYAYDHTRTLVCDRATLLLIDSAIIETPDGARRLRETIGGLPRWALPLFVYDGDGARGTRRAATVAAFVETLGESKTAQAGRVKEFVDALPRLVEQARHRFLRYGPNPDRADAVREPRPNIRGLPDSPSPQTGADN